MRKFVAVLLLLVLAALLYVPAANAVLVIRLMVSFMKLAEGSSEEGPAVTEKKVQRLHAGRSVQAILYRPSGSLPTRAAVLVPGISEQGVYHPRLIAFSRTLADKGFLILTPDIEAFRSFRVEPEHLEEVVFWFRQIGVLEGSQAVEKAGLAGISFSGTLALMAAALPDIRDKVGFVFAIGPYADLRELSHVWFAPAPEAGDGQYPTRFYAKWILMIAALPMLERDSERRFLRQVLIDLLLQRDPPEPPQEISGQAGNWYEFATTGGHNRELAREIVNYLTRRYYRKMDPAEAAKRVLCPVFLIHGKYDDLIPPEQSLKLEEMISSRTYLRITPFLTHTHPRELDLTWREKAEAVLDLFTFLYHFASAVR